MTELTREQIEEIEQRNAVRREEEADLCQIHGNGDPYDAGDCFQQAIDDIDALLALARRGLDDCPSCGHQPHPHCLHRRAKCAPPPAATDEQEEAGDA